MFSAAFIFRPILTPWPVSDPILSTLLTCELSDGRVCLPVCHSLTAVFCDAVNISQSVVKTHAVKVITIIFFENENMGIAIELYMLSAISLMIYAKLIWCWRVPSEIEALLSSFSVTTWVLRFVYNTQEMLHHCYDTIAYTWGLQERRLQYHQYYTPGQMMSWPVL